MRDISKAAELVRLYVKREMADISNDDEIGPAPGIYLAVLQAASDEETAHLGVALLCRNQSLSDPPYKFRGAEYDPRLQALADALGWAP
jgi:hypothetical protein